MAGSILKLTVDRQNRKLVGYNGTVGSMPDLFQTNVVSLQVQVVDPTGILFSPNNANAAYSVVDLTGFGLRASVGQAPQVSGGPNPLALQDTMVWDPSNKWFTGDLTLNTAAVDAFLGTSPVQPAYFELNLTTGANRITILQTNFNLRACVDETAAVAPPTGDVYLTKAEILAMFAQVLGPAGQTITFTSPDGTKKRILGVNNDGSALDDLVQ